MLRFLSTLCLAFLVGLSVTTFDRSGVSIAGELRIEVASDLQVTPEEAVSEASQRFEALLLAELLRRQPWATAPFLRPRLSGLWTSTEFAHNESTVELLKPYGTLYQRKIQFVVADSAIREWLEMQQGEYRQQVHWTLIAALLTIAACLAGGCIVLKLDRWTRGYQRTMIVGIAAVLLSAATISGWLAVQLNF